MRSPHFRLAGCLLIALVSACTESAQAPTGAGLCQGALRPDRHLDQPQLLRPRHDTRGPGDRYRL